MDHVNVLCITQARVGSSRLPKKVLLPLGNQTLLGVHLERLKKAKRIDKIIVATTFEPESEEIVKITREKGITVFKGSLDDVLDRFYQAAVSYKPTLVVRVTSDCPLIDPILIDQVIEEAIQEGYDYCANTLVEDFPDGQDVEVFTFNALEAAWKEANLPSEREHVTPYIRKQSKPDTRPYFKLGNFSAPESFGHLRMTVDEPKDMMVMDWLVNELGIDKDWLTYARFMEQHKNQLINTSIGRNEGYYKSVEKDNN